MSGTTSRRYPPELKQRVRMVAEIRADHESDWAAITQVAELLGVGTAETVRKWCRQAAVDAGKRAGVTSEEVAELKRLKRENAELRRCQRDSAQRAWPSRTGKTAIYTYPSKKSLASVMAKVRLLTRRAKHRTLTDLLRRLNPTLRG